MSDVKRYGINEGAVVAQDFGDETVIINLAKGLYYSVRGSASQVWTLLGQGFSAEETAGAIAKAYAIDEETVLTDVQALLTQMLRHELMVQSDAAPAGEPTTVTRGPYSTPSIDVHDDIGHLLALDPPVASLQKSLERRPWE